jgi:asparaginyl-tRNA synthetase
MEVWAKKAVRLEALSAHEGETVAVNAWVMNKRQGKGIVFLVLRDGSGFSQCIVAEKDVPEAVYERARLLTLESSIGLSAEVVRDERQIGGYELHLRELHLYHEAEEYPIGKKAHGTDFLMDHRHLWLRTRRQWAMMRVRNATIFAIHNFFQSRGFVQMDAPIFTGNACEGTTDLFQTDFFEETAYLSQSGQLYGEAMAMAMGKIYTFGPTFRAEKSKTRRHLSEFWMIEPEMAFHDLYMTMDLAEDFLRSVVGEVLERCRPELELLERPLEPLESVQKPFPRLEYDQAVRILKGEEAVDGRTTLEVLEKDLEAVENRLGELRTEIEERETALAAGGMKKGKIAQNEERLRSLKAELKEVEEKHRNLPQWMASARDFTPGDDFGGSDETVLTRMYDSPIMVYHWPTEIKAFYMKPVKDRPERVRGVDVLAPEGYGEIIGGGERETDKQRLLDQLAHHELPQSAFEWYLDLRRYGSVPHAGFGLGLERLLSWIAGIQHVRETIPFPRLMGRLFP